MKKKRFMVVKEVTDLKGTPRRDGPYEGLIRFYGEVPLTEPGCVMIIFYPSGERSRLKTTKVQTHSYDEATRTHTVTTQNSIYVLEEQFEDDDQKEGII